MLSSIGKFGVAARLAQPWGSYYGKLTDKFGVQWMLNCPPTRLG